MKFKEDDNRLNQTTYEPHKLDISVGRFPGGHDERPQNDLGTTPKKRVQPDNNKSAWQMTKDEYVKKEMSSKRKRGVVGAGRFGGAKGLKVEAEKWHKIMVKDALSRGMTVPPEVLVDYPDLTMRKESLENKEAWQMTKAEFLAPYYKRSKGSDFFPSGSRLGRSANKVIISQRRASLLASVEYHKKQVAQALANNKPVPPEVLVDYPDLTMKKESKAKELIKEIGKML